MSFMKIFRNTMMAAVALLIGVSLAACSDANEYEDANTNNPVFGTSHPESIEGTIWVRASGVKHGASTGKEVQGYVESLDFTLEDVDDAKQVAVTMSEGAYTDGTWVDESGTYEDTYSRLTSYSSKLTVKRNGFHGFHGCSKPLAISMASIRENPWNPLLLFVFEELSLSQT